MQHITNTATIRDLMHDKQALEVRLAWELLEVFNDPAMGFIGRLREMVRRSVSEMDEIANDNLFRTQFQKKWSDNWRNYAVCTDNGIRDWRPGIIWMKSEHFIAQHCADWIRIFGEVIEDVAKGERDARRKSFQKGDPYHWTKFKVGKVGKGDQPEAGRRRVGEADMGDVGVLTDYAREKAHAEYWEQQKHQLGGKAGPAARAVWDLTVWGFQRDISPSAGINRWRVMEQDTIGKMDQVFGLMPGATISGTTTDNIFFFQRFGGLELDPIFYLLPTATIVAGGHHSLLEVALPLTLNAYGNYKVGLYTTLLPRGTQAEHRPAGVGELDSILRVAENHADNHLMLVYYKGSDPVGCWLYDDAHDKHTWRGIVTGEPLMAAFRHLPAWPNEAQIKELKRALHV